MEAKSDKGVRENAWRDTKGAIGATRAGDKRAVHGHVLSVTVCFPHDVFTLIYFPRMSNLTFSMVRKMAE